MTDSSDRTMFFAENNLVLLLDQEELADGTLVLHSTTLWCEACDRYHARYIARALNQVGIKEILNGSE